MLEWSAEQPTEMTTTAIDLEFLPTDTNVDRGVQNLEFVVQQMHTALTALTSYEANDIVANSRKNPLEAWRRLQKRYDPTTGGRKRNLLRTIILFWTVFSCGTASGDRTLGVLRVSLREEDEGQVGRRDQACRSWRRLHERYGPASFSGTLFSSGTSMRELNAGRPMKRDARRS